MIMEQLYQKKRIFRKKLVLELSVFNEDYCAYFNLKGILVFLNFV